MTASPSALRPHEAGDDVGTFDDHVGSFGDRTLDQRLDPDRDGRHLLAEPDDDRVIRRRQLLLARPRRR